MNYPQMKKTWGMPLLLSCLTLFGLLAALLGTGFYYWLAWLAMVVPLAVVLWKTNVKKY